MQQNHATDPTRIDRIHLRNLSICQISGLLTMTVMVITQTPEPEDYAETSP